MKNKLLLITFFCLFQIGLSAQTWQKVACGTEFTVALRSDSTLWAWGANMSGQLGIGNLITQQLPVQIGVDHNWKDIVAGAIHCMALKDDGTLWAWGLNGNGQLGNATNTDSSSPVQIGNDSNWDKISIGQANSFAIKTNGTLWAWGHNYYGQIGDSTNVDKNIPVKVGADTNWKDVSGGGFHTLAIKTNGTLWAWGYNGEGELGDSTTTSDSIPKQIGSDCNWSKISAGTMYSLGLKTDGTIWSWGFNGNGQLGIGANDKVSKAITELKAVQIGEDTDWKSITAGSSFAFAIKNDSTLWGWGFNYYGQLGNGNTTQLDYPKKTGTETNWKSIAAACGFLYNGGVYGMHTMGLKYQNDGVCAAGANYIGQIGNGSTVSQEQFDCNIGSTSVAEVLNDNSTMVYPNPAKESITFETGLDNKFQLTIFSSIGQTILQKDFTSDKNTIDIQDFKPGIYFYNLLNKNGKVTSGKFVKE